MARSVVVFPHPDGPRSVKSSPSGIVKLGGLNAAGAAGGVGYSLVSSATSRAAEVTGTRSFFRWLRQGHGVCIEIASPQRGGKFSACFIERAEKHSSFGLAVTGGSICSAKRTLASSRLSNMASGVKTSSCFPFRPGTILRSMGVVSTSRVGGEIIGRAQHFLALARKHEID